MEAGEIICGSCGWRNESTARMCGGCGRPLRATSGPGGAGGRVAATVSTRLAVDDDAPTVPDIPLSAIPTPARPRGTPAYPRTPPPAPSSTPAGGASRGLLIVAAALAIVIALCAGSWGLLLRPALHGQIDGTLRSQVSGLVSQVNQQQGLQSLPSATLTVKAQDVTRELQAATSSDSPVRNVKASFSGGRIGVSFTSFGGDGALSTVFVVNNGRISASATRVDGALALIESGDEAESAMNDALSNLRTDVIITQISSDNDVLSVGIKGTKALPSQGAAPQG